MSISPSLPAIAPATPRGERPARWLTWRDLVDVHIAGWRSSLLRADAELLPIFARQRTGHPEGVSGRRAG